jgi:transposase-like protein
MPECRLSQIPTPGKLRSIFKKAIFGSHVHCPWCNSRRIRVIRSESRWRCRRCDKPFSIKSCSWLRGSKLSLEDIWLLLYYWQKRITLQQAVDFTDLSYPTVRSWYGRFREHIPKEKLDIMLEDAVACDEMYTKGNSVIGAKQKGTRNVALKVLHTKSVNKKQAVEFLMRAVKAKSELHTDGAGIYRGVGNWHKLKHTYEVHSKWEFSLTAEIEGIWAVFRTFVRRMYHHVTSYKLEELVSEFVLRFRQDEVFASPHQYLAICLTSKPLAF